jgi:hypothetical protein
MPLANSRGILYALACPRPSVLLQTIQTHFGVPEIRSKGRVCNHDDAMVLCACPDRVSEDRPDKQYVLKNIPFLCEPFRDAGHWRS